MQVSARLHYACMAMLDLAMHHSADRPVTLREIVARQNIPQPFLVQILQTLRTAGLVFSTRGSSGGYRLALDPEMISLLDIATAIGGLGGYGTAGTGDVEEENRAAVVLHQSWNRAEEAARGILAQTHLSDLVADLRGTPAAMFYI